MTDFSAHSHGDRIQGAARSTIGKRRTENQDAVGFFPDLMLYAIADGVGGHAGGRIASRLSIEVINGSLRETNGEDLTPVAIPGGQYSVVGRRLLIALQDANDRVFDAARKDPRLKGMGAAVAAVLFDDKSGSVAICHVGDTRVYRIRRNQIEQLTEDQTLVQQLLRRGKITPEEIPSSPHRHVLTQAVGSQSLVQPQLRLEKTEPGDVFVLSSDGLHDVVGTDDIPPVIQDACSNLRDACSRLIELADQRGRTDDTTVLVLACEPRPNAIPAPNDTL